MSVINVFRNYMAKHHPHLAHNDWKVDVRLVSVQDIPNEHLKAIIPKEITEPITCWLFYYDSGLNNIVCLLQDKRGVKDFGIGLLKNGELVNPISFI
ncbi:hypothetical protein [Paraliobacillus sp. JSM ZJ581]|uniref:hypothetical protein n=1 Tax=Paraliobacillus sp. JSM ZJ581 TaxID=3342118 RepID=UPI0035A84A9B